MTTYFRWKAIQFALKKKNIKKEEFESWFNSKAMPVINTQIKTDDYLREYS